MRVALVDVSAAAAITRVETDAPGSTLQLTPSVGAARRELREEGYMEVWGFPSEASQQLLVFVHEDRPRVPAALTERVKAELAVLQIRRAELDVEIEKVLQVERLALAHGQLSSFERDHHEINHCQCATAMAWRAAKEA